LCETHLALTEFNGSTLGEENVACLDITMYEATTVQILEAVQSFIADCSYFFLSQRLLVD